MPKKYVPFGEFLASRTVERSKAEPKLQPNSDDLSQLIHLFPDIDRDYARFCLQCYTHDRVASVTGKLLDRNFSNYPRHVPPSEV
jgi:CUE domain